MPNTPDTMNCAPTVRDSFGSSTKETDTRPRLWAAGITFAMYDGLDPSALQRTMDNVEALVVELRKAKGPTNFIPKRNGLAAHAAAYAVVASFFGVVVTALSMEQMDLGNGQQWVWIVKEAEGEDLNAFGPATDPANDMAQLALLLAGMIGQQRELDGKMRKGTVLLDLVMSEYFAFLLSKKTGRTVDGLRNEATFRVVNILKAHYSSYNALRTRLLFNETVPPELLSELLGSIRTPTAAAERGAASVH